MFQFLKQRDDRSIPLQIKVQLGIPIEKKDLYIDGNLEWDNLGKNTPKIPSGLHVTGDLIYLPYDSFPPRDITVDGSLILMITARSQLAKMYELIGSEEPDFTHGEILIELIKRLRARYPNVNEIEYI